MGECGLGWWFLATKGVSMTDEVKPESAWNRSFGLIEGERRFWQIGPFQLWATALPSEIRLALARGDDPLETTLAIEGPNTCRDVPEETDVRRFGFRLPPDSLELVPALADRPVVVSPEAPLMLPPDEEVTVFVSTPLWVRVVAGDRESVLLDEPTHRPSDSWFGPSTMEGELCYASRTNARMNLENLPVRPHRAISVVRVKNGSTTDLNIEKLRLPTPQMSVFVTAKGRYWTEGVTLERHEKDEPAAVRFDQGPPDEAPDATLAAVPRSPSQRGLLTRTFAGILQ